MDNNLLLNLDHHRSRERIADLGEVFTPKQYVQRMLDLFDTKLWSDENVTFFEPSAGHGNIVLPIIARRTEALAKKYKRASVSEPLKCAIANCLNTLWAIDICGVNVDQLRSRIFVYVYQCLLHEGFTLKSARNREFIGHVICTLLWQIQENEALSAIVPEANALRQTTRTKLGQTWIRKNGHKPINFANDWCTYFSNQVQAGATVIQFERAMKFVASIAEGNPVKGHPEFDFARAALTIANSKQLRRSGKAS